ncbi:MAG: tryptophan--tRNA ligase [Phycisphaerae bacterium]|nr:tryptophan--tRNA ligase [Phycisphaerae bacterium]
MRVLSGIQPSGKLHLGNYYGAMQQHLELQREHEGLYFIANYHALTTLRDPELLVRYTQDVALDYLALGLDPARTIFFRQSDVPQVTELSWILSTITPMGLLQRCVSYKEKLERGIPADHGLFAYPVLMAADILIYKSELVPVGKDQKQHIEVTQDIAQKFNQTYGEILVIPKERTLESTAVVPGLDGQKMSKSYDNTIEIFADPKTIKRKVMSIVTDSTPLEEPKDPDRCNVMALLRLVADPSERTEWEQRYRQGGTGYGHAKKRLIELLVEYFQPYREKRAELEKDPAYVESVLQDGARRARALAEPTLREVREATGMQYTS